MRTKEVGSMKKYSIIYAFTEARERDPEEQSAVLGGKLTDRKCLDVLNAHCRRRSAA